MMSEERETLAIQYEQIVELQEENKRLRDERHKALTSAATKQTRIAELEEGFVALRRSLWKAGYYEDHPWISLIDQLHISEGGGE